MKRRGDGVPCTALVPVLLLLSAASASAGRPEFHLGGWTGWNPDESGYLCPGGSADDDDSARTSRGGDLVARFHGPTGLWISGGSRTEPRRCVGGTDSVTWVTAGGLLAGRAADRLTVELRGGAGSLWAEDGPGVWVIEGQLGIIGRVHGRLALTLAGGAQRRDNESLDHEDFFGRAGIRFGPL